MIKNEFIDLILQSNLGESNNFLKKEYELAENKDGFIDLIFFAYAKLIDKHQDDSEIGHNVGAFELYTLRENIKDLIYEIYKTELKSNSDRALGNKFDFREGRNIFNDLPLEKVIDHFSPLYKKKKNDELSCWLSKDVFDQFIYRSFVQNNYNLEAPKIIINHGEKQAIINLFHSFFSLSIQELSEYGKRKKYLELLKNSFDCNRVKNISIDNFKWMECKYQWI